MSRCSLLIALVAITACDVLPRVDAGVTLRPGPDPDALCLSFPEVIDFGEVPTHTAAAIEVRVTNPSYRGIRMRVQQPRAPFGSSLPNENFDVQAGTSGRMNFTFEPPDGRLHILDLDVVGGELGCPVQRVRLQGLGAGTLEALDTLDFDPLSPGASATKSLQLVNARRTELTVTTSINSPDFSVESQLTIPALATVEVPVHFTAPMLEGAYRARLTVRTDARDSLDVAVSAMSGIPRAYLDRIRLEMTPMPLVSPADRSIFVRNAGSGLLRLVGSTVTPGAGSSLSEVSVRLPVVRELAPGEIERVVIALSPTGIGLRSWKVTLLTNDPLQPMIPIDLTAYVQMLEPCIEAMEVTPTVQSVAPPYPVDALLQFTNATSRDCLVQALNFSAPMPWFFDLGLSDSFVVPARSTATRTVTVTNSGNATILWQTNSTAQSVRILAQGP